MTASTSHSTSGGASPQRAFLRTWRAEGGFDLREWCRMLRFHVRQFGRVGYFVQLTVVGTISAVLLQRLMVDTGEALGEMVWLRSAEIGLWTTCTASAGIIGYQRFQGTLAPILVGRRVAGSLSALVAASATFGLLSFPLSAALVAVLGGPVIVTGTTVVGIIMVWLGTLAVGLVISSLFVLTPYAITYEPLLLVPLLLLSGIMGYPSWLPSGVGVLSLFLPFGAGVRLLALASGGVPSSVNFWALLAVGLGSSALWLVLARTLLNQCLRRARIEGSLEVV